MDQQHVHPAEGGAAVQMIGEDVVYSASSLGHCTRALAAARQGLEKWTGELSEGLQATFNKGHKAEDIAAEKYESDGWSVSRQPTVRIPVTGKISVVGHPDFTLNKGTSWFVADAKRQNDKEWVKKTIQESMWWARYEWQFSVYMIGTGLHMIVIRVNDAGGIKTNFVANPPKSRGDILRRVLEVESLARKDLKQVECDHNDYPCDYFHLLHPRKEKEVEVVGEKTDEELANLALHYKRLEGDIKPLRELEKRQKELKAAIIKRVEVPGIWKESGSGIIVRVTSSPTSQRVTPPGTMTRVTITLPNNGDDADDEG